MRKIAEIRKDLNAKINEIKGLDANNVEAMEKATEELRALTVELNAANEVEAAEQRAAEQKLDDIQKKEGRSFSFMKFVRELSEGHLTGIEAEAAEMGAEEYRRLGLSQQGAVIPGALLRSASGQKAGADADGGYFKETMATRYAEHLKEKLAISKLGATVLTDLVGTLPVVTAAQIAAAWDAEGDDASFTKSTIARTTMTPHRNVVMCAVTKDLLRQTSFDVENLLVNLMSEAHANLIEKAAIAGTGSSDQPTGILAGCTSGNSNLVVMNSTTGGAISWAKVIELETVLNGNKGNRGRVAYLTNAKVWGSMKGTVCGSNTSRFILDGDYSRVNGYPVDWSGYVPSDLTIGTGESAVTGLSAMIIGNFQDLWIGQWGGLDLVIDPYTKAKSGEIVLTINAWNDVCVTNVKSFAAIKDIIA